MWPSRRADRRKGKLEDRGMGGSGKKKKVRGRRRKRQRRGILEKRRDKHPHIKL